MIGLLGLLVGQAAWAQGCPDLGDTLRQVSAAVDEVRLEEAEEMAGQATNALGCQTEVVNSLTLVALYQAAGAVQYFLGHFNDADDLFARAVAVAPASRLDPAYGDAPSTIYENIRAATLSAAAGSLSGPDQVDAWVDGRPLSADYPLDVAPGHHLIQVRTPSGGLLNTVHRIAPGEKLIVTRDGAVQVVRKERPPEGQPVQQPLITSGATPSEPGGRRVGLLAVGGLGVAAGAVGIVLASFSHEQFFQATSVDDLDTLRLRTNALAAGGIGLAAVGAGIVGVGVVPRKTGADVLFTWRF